MSRLVLCVHCARHVRRDERACPFCFGPLSATKAPSSLRAPVLTRAALLVAGAAAGALAVGCGDEGDDAFDTGEEGIDKDDELLRERDGGAMAQPAYGVPIDDKELPQPAYGVPIDDQELVQPAYGVPIDEPEMAQPAYGVPIEEDAAVRTRPFEKWDAGVSLPQPAYGVPVDDR